MRAIAFLPNLVMLKKIVTVCVVACHSSRTAPHLIVMPRLELILMPLMWHAGLSQAMSGTLVGGVMLPLVLTRPPNGRCSL